MSITKALSESQFLQETTFHGFVYLRHSKSKIRLVFWLVVTISAMVYAAFEVAREVKRFSSEVQFDVTYRLAKRHEIQFPFWSLCHKNPFDVLDWQAFLIFKQMNNWTVANMGDLILSSGYFDNLPFNREKSVDRLREKLALSLASKRASNLTHEKTKLIAKQFVSIMIKKQSCDSNCSMCGEDNGRGASTTAAIHLFQVAEYTCKVVFCQAPYSAQSQVDRPRIDVTYLDWKSYEVNDVRMKFMRYMSKEHDSNLPLDDQLYLVIDSESLIIELKRNAINDFNVRPLMHNWATNAHVPCQKRVCTEDDEHVSSCYSGKRKEKISGVDCFTWQYEMQSVTNKLFTVQGNIANIMKLNASFEATHLVLLFPYYNDWPVREYKPVFVWYKVLSNIGGTLSIWTGASVLSFLHLFQSFCCRSFSYSKKIEPIMIGRQFV